MAENNVILESLRSQFSADQHRIEQQTTATESLVSAIQVKLEKMQSDHLLELE